jgi:AcrR family transcriptional regulator
LALSPERREARRRHLVVTAQALMREAGDAGFSMKDLAARAGLSPATPYNLVGGKADLLRLVVRDEFERFGDKLSAMPAESPLERLVSATGLVVRHYVEDRPFYRSLFHAALGSASPEVRDFMSGEGRQLWCALVQAAMDAGELAPALQTIPTTDALLRTISGVTEAWLASDWTNERFALEMRSGVGLMLASAATEAHQQRLLDDVADAQRAIVALPAAAETPPSLAAGR